MDKYINVKDINYFYIPSRGMSVEKVASKKDIDNIQYADVEPVTHAHWIPCTHVIHADEDCYVRYVCSRCDREIWINHSSENLSDYPYCHCGAKMDEEVK